MDCQAISVSFIKDVMRYVKAEGKSAAVNNPTLSSTFSIHRLTKRFTPNSGRCSRVFSSFQA